MSKLLFVTGSRRRLSAVKQIKLNEKIYDGVTQTCIDLRTYQYAAVLFL